MDPTACLDRLLRAVREYGENGAEQERCLETRGDVESLESSAEDLREEATEAARELTSWLDNGGFMPGVPDGWSLRSRP